MPESSLVPSFFRASFVRRQPFILAAVLSLLLSACGKESAPAQGGPGGAAPPPAQVGVVTVTQGDVGLITELPGRLEASRVAQVRARDQGNACKNDDKAKNGKAAVGDVKKSLGDVVCHAGGTSAYCLEL